MRVFEPVLLERHRALGARITEFGGWLMPLSYLGGSLAEHRACRTSAAVFDVSHLGTVRITGPSAFGRLQRAFTNDLDRIAPGGAQYTHLLADDGSVLDDIIVWWVAENRFDVMPNASNTDRVRDALELGADADVTHERAVLAVQGPHARSILATVCPAAASVARFAVEVVEHDGVELVVAGTGYTGEDGVEIAVPASHADDLWQAIVAGGCEPAGLGARDSLRLEAGLPLHGHELGPGISPLQAGLGWVVAWKKGDFRGREAIAEEKARGPIRRLRGILAEGRRPPRTGYDVLIDGVRCGVVTSGGFSPTLDRGVALALLNSDIGPGSPVALRARDDLVLDGVVVRLPFVTRG